MKMKNIKSLFAGLLSASLLFTACSDDFLDTFPTDQVSSESAVASTGTPCHRPGIDLGPDPCWPVLACWRSQDRESQGDGAPDLGQ